jgi:pimeloyl-ACP methyl ester carboxylesterase
MKQIDRRGASMKHRHMNRATVEGIELEYETRGSGEPVVLIHPGHFADWFAPLLDEPALADGYHLIRYHRVGCAGSGHLAGPVTLAQQAAHCTSLMRYLEIERAHVVGHSSSGNIALQMALDFPDAVQSLSLLEPALLTVPSAHTSRAFVASALQHYHGGDSALAVDTFLQGVCGPGYRAVLDRVLPGGFDQYVADAGTFFGQELPALQQWSFTREDAGRISQPVLAVLGARSPEMGIIWKERHELLLAWLPNVEPFVLSGAAHLLQVENPGGMASGLAAFIARHPLSATM